MPHGKKKSKAKKKSKKDGNESAGSEVGEQPPKDFYDSDDSELQMVFEVENKDESAKEKKRNRVYEHVKKEIEVRARTKENKDDKKRGFFVDKHRNIAVVMGTRDIKIDAKQRKITRRQKGEDLEEDIDYMTFVNQAVFELRSGSAEIAIEYLDQAVKGNPDDETPFVVRSRCLNKLERPEEAIIDAEKALYLNNCSTRAIIAKAEALYNLGQFEKALVQFERGWRVRQDPEIKIGIVKCRDVILNTVGANAGEYDIEVVEKVIQQMKEMDIAKKNKPDTESEEHLEVQKKRKAKKDPDLLVLGRMNEDVKFLEDFLKFHKPKQDIYGYQRQVKNMAADALDYLEKRKSFWQQTVAAKTKL